MLLTVNPFNVKRFRETIHGFEAEMTAEEAIACSDPNAEQWWEINNHASALYLTGRTEEALEFAMKSLRIKRAIPNLVNMAVILETLSRFDDALKYAFEACYLDKDDDRAKALYGEALLRMGRLREGWPLYAKYRASHGWLLDYCKEWNGENLNGKRLLVLEGGGYGDNIYFMRWLDTLRREGAAIDYICQPSFAPLVRHMGYTAIENWAGNVDIDFTKYDYFTSILGLAWKLGVTFNNYTYKPYVKKFFSPHIKSKVGFCWRSGEGKSPRKQRSLTVDHVELITKSIPDDQLVNLTYAHDFPKHTPPIKDWLDTVKIMSGLDLIVTVDTGIAHLAGAMNIPVWVILPGASAWQYPIYTDNHPFYPSMRMFRNEGEGIDHAVNMTILALRRGQ